jgi:hypothetical protein
MQKQISRESEREKGEEGKMSWGECAYYVVVVVVVVCCLLLLLLLLLLTILLSLCAVCVY